MSTNKRERRAAIEMNTLAIIIIVAIFIVLGIFFLLKGLGSININLGF